MLTDSGNAISIATQAEAPQAAPTLAGRFHPVAQAAIAKAENATYIPRFPNNEAALTELARGLFNTNEYLYVD
jgi:hypothetical protein